ncbi:MAG: ABC transporter permease [Gammaproteobacteria bacterium]|uniref:ABC transporter permease n=1 Tax=unclassified Pseudacidovorax TaxID=2620592 RepID=UPI001B5724FF|nr:ABC transporter permease [Pseudacidovorax sp.]MBP6897932.1 ABC transporter permease [Pseudacidovorax sp.]
MTSPSSSSLPLATEPAVGTAFQRAGFWRRLLRRPGSRLALAWLVLLLAAALLAPWVGRVDPLSGGGDALLRPFSAGHWLGTDDLGRDVWARVVHGSRISLIVGVASALLAVAVGVIVGALAGYFGGLLDAVLMRTAEFFQTLPRFVVALIVIALYGTSVFKMVLVIAALSWPQLARVVRASVASLRQSQFVEAARVAGMGHGGIILRQILPNVAAPIIVLGSLDIAMAILIEASLSFFGLGDPNQVSWGTMLNEAQQYLRDAWWMSVFPGLAIALTVLGFNLMGDALNDALNPRGESFR